MMKKAVETIIPVFIVLLYLTGCASQKEIMIEQGYPPVYAEGYQDGCNSGNNAAGSIMDQFKKNIQRYEQDSNYRQGWDDGYKQCKAKQDSFQQQYRTTLEQQRLIEEKRHNKEVEDRELLKGIDTRGLEKYK